MTDINRVYLILELVRFEMSHREIVTLHIFVEYSQHVGSTAALLQKCDELRHTVPVVAKYVHK